MRAPLLTVCAALIFIGFTLPARDFSSPVGGKTKAPPPEEKTPNEKTPETRDPDDKKGDKKNADSEPRDDVWKEHVVPGAAVTLRLKRAAHKQLLYDGSIDRSQRSNTSYSEQDSFILSVGCADQKNVPINGQDKILDMLALRRTYTDRKRIETLENGKSTNVALPNIDELINMGPNFDVVDGMKCYAFDDRNIMATRTEQVLTLKDDSQLHGRIVTETADKIIFSTGEDNIDVSRNEVIATSLVSVPHVFINESPHYMFPLFSERAVSPGDTWVFKIPVIIPLEQGRPAKVWPTQFTVRMTGRLREVREGKGGQVAVVDYHVNGLFDSAADEFISRFPGFAPNNRLSHKVSGEGTVLVDIQNGRILEKTESFNITLLATSLLIQGADKPGKQDNHKAEIRSTYRIKLLMPGTKLKNGAIIPEF